MSDQMAHMNVEKANFLSSTSEAGQLQVLGPPPRENRSFGMNNFDLLRILAATPDGSRVYVANLVSDTVSVIDAATTTVTATIPVGTKSRAFGVFIPIPVPLRRRSVQGFLARLKSLGAPAGR
jgi:YVTN family beta-propeller protein